jgi:DNA invertase Pin-like site-specific DNA recombinase
VATLHQLHAWGVSLIAQHGLQFDLATPAGKLNASIMAALAEFERDLLRERVRSGIAAAKAKGRTFGRKLGQRPSDRLAGKVLSLREENRSYRWIAKELQISKNTALAIAKRASENKKDLQCPP